MAYVIRRTDQGGGYVASPSNNGGGSYTHDLRLARRFATPESAKREMCGNEILVALDSEFVNRVET